MNRASSAASSFARASRCSSSMDGSNFATNLLAADSTPGVPEKSLARRAFFRTGTARGSPISTSTSANLKAQLRCALICSRIASTAAAPPALRIGNAAFTLDQYAPSDGPYGAAASAKYSSFVLTTCADASGEGVTGGAFTAGLITSRTGLGFGFGRNQSNRPIARLPLVSPGFPFWLPASVSVSHVANCRPSNVDLLGTNSAKSRLLTPPDANSAQPQITEIGKLSLLSVTSKNTSSTPIPVAFGARTARLGFGERGPDRRSVISRAS